MKRMLAYVYLPFACLYLVMSVVYPTDPMTIAKRHLSTADARIAALSLAVSLIVIWFFALYGSWRFKQYALGIKQSSDGAAFVRLATGIQILALFMPVRSVSKIMLNYSAHVYPSVTTATNLVISYTNIIVPLVAYVIIGLAAKQLLLLTKASISARAMYTIIAVFSLLAASYCYAVFGISRELSPSDWLITIEYNIPLPLQITTVVMPFIFMWCVGLIAAYEIFLFQRHVKGVFYRQTLRLLSVGLSLELLASIYVQFVTSVSASLWKLPSIAVIGVLYSALMVTAVAFVMISRGVNKLKRLEEV